MINLALIGCGNMGSAMVAGWLLGGEDPASFTAVRPSGREVPVKVLAAEPFTG